MKQINSFQYYRDYLKALNLSLAIASGLIAYLYAVNIGGLTLLNFDLFVAPLLTATATLLPLYYLKVRDLTFKSSRGSLIELHYAAAMLSFWVIFMTSGFTVALFASVAVALSATWKGVLLFRKMEADVVDGTMNLT
jgi:hypothetical protein